MKDLSDISIWKKSFGLLPIRLKPANNNFEFVMLNGGTGDFCLQTQDDINKDIDY